MIDCNGCYINKLFENDEERMRCLHRDTCERAYQQGKADAIDECIVILENIMPSRPILTKRKCYENWKMKTTELRMLREMLEQMKGESE